MSYICEQIILNTEKGKVPLKMDIVPALLIGLRIDPKVFIGHSDDFASIYEVIYRRFKKWSRFKIEGGDFSSLHDKKNSKLENDLLNDWPNLIMIDGGKGQLNAALKALKI